MNKFIWFCLSLVLAFAATAQPTNIRGGNMRIEQLSDQTVRITVNLLSKLHTSPLNLELCWGDGVCEQWATTLVNEWPALDTRQYQMQTFHGYTQPGTYEVQVTACCWAEDLKNLASATDRDFVLNTSFYFAGDQAAQRNSMPDLALLTAVCPLEACSYLPEINDPEADSLVWSICLPEIGGFFPLEEVAPSPLNNVSLNPQTGSLSWVSPPFEGLYSHAFCLQEFRDEQLLSESEYFTLIVVNNSLSTKELPETTFTLSPNPATDQITINDLAPAWQTASCQVYNFYGKMIWEQASLNPVVVSDWPAGVYFMVLEKEGQRIGQQFLKQ